MNSKAQQINEIFKLFGGSYGATESAPNESVSGNSYVISGAEIGLIVICALIFVGSVIGIVVVCWIRKK